MPGSLIELMSKMCGLYCNCIVRPCFGLGGLALFMTTHRGGNVSGRTQESCVLVPLKLKLVLVGGGDCEGQFEEVRCTAGQQFGSITLKYNLVTSPMCSWMHFLTYCCDLPIGKQLHDEDAQQLTLYRTPAVRHDLLPPKAHAQSTLNFAGQLQGRWLTLSLPIYKYKMVVL